MRGGLVIAVLLFFFAIAAYARGPMEGSAKTVGLGYTDIVYSEGGFGTLRMHAITGKISYDLAVFPRRCDVNALLFGNIYSENVSFVPASSSYFSGHPPTAHFVGMNARFGCRVIRPAKWTLAVMAGTYYLTMLVPGNVYGFRNIMGPQLYPAVHGALSTKNFMDIYAKFSPMARNFQLADLSNREIAAGASIGHTMKGGSSYTLQLDASNLRILIPPAQIVSNTLSLSLAMTW